MPIVHVEMLEGRSLDQKRALVRELTDVVVRVCDVEPSSVRVVLIEVPPAHWAVAGQLLADRGATGRAQGQGDGVPGPG